MKRHKRSATVSTCSMLCCATQTKVVTKQGTRANTQGKQPDCSAETYSNSKRKRKQSETVPNPLPQPIIQEQNSKECDDSLPDHLPQGNSSDSDSDSDSTTDVINDHTRLLTGSHTVRILEPDSTPISYSVPKSLSKKIKNNRFIDFLRQQVIIKLQVLL